MIFIYILVISLLDSLALFTKSIFVSLVTGYNILVRIIPAVLIFLVSLSILIGSVDIFLYYIISLNLGLVYILLLASSLLLASITASSNLKERLIVR